MAKKKLYYDSLDVRITSSYIRIGEQSYPLEKISSARFQEHKTKTKIANYRNHIKDGMLYLGAIIIGLGFLYSSTPWSNGAEKLIELLPFLLIGGGLLFCSYKYNSYPSGVEKNKINISYKLRLSLSFETDIHTSQKTSQIIEVFSTPYKTEAKEIIKAINRALKEFSSRRKINQNKNFNMIINTLDRTIKELSFGKQRSSE